MNGALERLGIWAARRRWWVIAAWVLILVGLWLGRSAFGGTFVNDYSVPGSQSSAGPRRAARPTSRPQSGYGGQIVFHADDRQGRRPVQAAVETAMKNVGDAAARGLRDRPAAVSRTRRPSPRTAPSRTATCPGTSCPTSLDTAYLHQLDDAVEPARQAGLTVEYGGGAGQIGQTTDDRDSEIIGLTCALLLLLFMFGVDRRGRDPAGRRDLQRRRRAGLVGLLAAATTLPDHRADGRHAARPRRRRRLRAVPGGPAPRAARPRHAGGAVDRPHGRDVRGGDRGRRQHGRRRDPRPVRLRGPVRRRARPGLGRSSSRSPCSPR